MLYRISGGTGHGYDNRHGYDGGSRLRLPNRRADDQSVPRQADIGRFAPQRRPAGRSRRRAEGAAVNSRGHPPSGLASASPATGSSGWPGIPEAPSRATTVGAGTSWAD